MKLLVGASTIEAQSVSINHAMTKLFPFLLCYFKLSDKTNIKTVLKKFMQIVFRSESQYPKK